MIKKSWMTLLLVLFFTAPVLAQEAQPGDSCTAGQTSNVVFSGGPEISGGNFLICDGANWLSLIEYKDNGQSVLQFDYESGPCTAVKDGRVRYNSVAARKFEYCDGGTTTWKAFKQPQCSNDDSTACFLDPTRSNSDSDFAAANISSGKTIMGIAGSYAGGGGGFVKTWYEQPKLFASDVADSDGFGDGIALDGDALFLGASSEDGAGTDRGAVYAFDRDSNRDWSQLQKLTASDAANADAFGKAIALDGDTAVIGAPSEDGAGTDRGAAYVFNRASDGSWSQSQKLTASDAADSDAFGISVGIDGDAIVVGAHLEDGSGTDRGAAYVFERASNATWTEAQKLTASDTENSDNFGASVAVEGSYIVMGAPNEDDAAGCSATGNCGAAYVFVRSSAGSWSQKNKLVSDDVDDADQFGADVAIDGDLIVVGAKDDDDAAGCSASGNCGAAYVYERNNSGSWSFLEKIVSDDIEDGDAFGDSLDIEGDLIMIGAPMEDDATGCSATGNCGASYLFKRASDGTWSQLTKYTASDAEDDDRFGATVALDGGTVASGAYNEDDASGCTTNCGAAYVHYLEIGTDPPGFYFADHTAVAPSLLVESNIRKIVGMDGLSISISGDGSPAYRICSNADCSTVAHNWGSASGTIDLGEYVQIRTTSSASQATTNTVTLTIGLGSDDWEVTTNDLTIFVTSTTGKANGLVATNYGDDECVARAAAASLTGTFQGWVSDGSNSAASRMSWGAKLANYRNTNGDKVADNWADLTDGSLDAAVGYDETGTSYSGAVWTGTTTAGAADDDTCTDWSSGGGGSGSAAEGSGADIGDSTATNGDWTAVTGAAGNYKCGSSLPIYCVEQ